MMEGPMFEPMTDEEVFRHFGIIPGGRRKQPHHMYIHIDPGTRELLYIGISYDHQRPRDFTSRSVEHSARLRGLLRDGWSRDQIVRTVWNNMTYEGSRRLELGAIREMQPTFNRQGRTAVMEARS
jgi:hypothetical protein